MMSLRKEYYDLSVMSEAGIDALMSSIDSDLDTDGEDNFDSDDDVADPTYDFADADNLIDECLNSTEVDSVNLRNMNITEVENEVTASSSKVGCSASVRKKMDHLPVCSSGETQKT